MPDMQRATEAEVAEGGFYEDDGDLTCGCGDPDIARGLAVRILRLMPLYEHGWVLKGMIPEESTRYALLYWLTNADLIEHGSTVDGSWLTDKGKEFLRVWGDLG